MLGHLLTFPGSCMFHQSKGAFSFLGNKVLFNFKNLKLKSLLHFLSPPAQSKLKFHCKSFMDSY